ncbi:MAG: GldG family protein [candidate division KSB1 bacterium]|nr:GldG family protein [candidate division KSB1 bacterium]MDZ7301410.1 GldG family protein [candidate division KSB1 bacterium]MDZ7313444.1 GldG family protein [candidate division KSB1 bacterium]
MLLATCTLLLSGIYYPTTIHYTYPYVQVVTLLVATIITAALALRQVEFPMLERRIYPLLIVLLFFIVIIPWPYRLPGLLLIIGLLLSRVNRLPKIVRPIANSLLFTGLIAAGQMLIMPSYYLLFSRYHRLDWATPMVTLIMKAVGVEATTSAGALFLREGDKVFSFLTTWDSLGLYPILNIWIGGLLTLWLFRQRWQQAVYLSAILLGYMFLRYAAAIFFFLNLQDAAVFWKHEFTFLTLLPLAVILPKWIPLQISSSRADWVTNRRLLPAFFATALLVFSLVGIWGFHDPGIKKAGRVLIDEKHSNWEWTTEEFDTKWYGQKSTYNYFSLFEYLRYFYDVEQSHAKLADTLLNKCDVLILKTPTEPFAKSEIDAIVNFVRQGGGLFLIGDHTNVFGITTNLNPLAQRFGLKFRYDFQSDISSELSVYRRPVILPHPVVQYMPAFMFASGCMLEAPLTAENVIIGYAQRSLYLDYAEKNFFPRDKVNEETMEFGLFLQAAGARFGRGRVLGFTDSTVWSNFYMHIPGKPELLLGCIEWLNRQNSWWGILRKLFLALAIFSLVGVFWAGTKISRAEFLWMAIFSIALAVPISATIFAFASRAAYPTPQPKRDFIQVNFEMEHSRYELPILHMTQNQEHSFHTFYMWPQRLGMVPAVKTKFKEALADGDAVVIINPHEPFSDNELWRFRNYLEAGGKALILDDPTGPSVANQLLAAFGMRTAPIWSDSATVFVWRNGADSTQFFGKLTGEVSGGIPVVFAKARESALTPRWPNVLPQQPLPLLIQNLPASSNLRSGQQSRHTNVKLRKPVLSMQRVGKGLIAVMSSSPLFTDREMGSGSVQPPPNMQKIYELDYWIFSELLQLGSRKS